MALLIASFLLESLAGSSLPLRIHLTVCLAVLFALNLASIQEKTNG